MWVPGSLQVVGGGVHQRRGLEVIRLLNAGAVTQVFTWGHVVHVDSFGLLGTTSQHHAFRNISEGKMISSAGDMGRLLSITCDKVQREAGLPVTHLTANTLRHMYVVWARTPGQQFTAGAEAGAQVRTWGPLQWSAAPWGSLWEPVESYSHP
jgi:hypothetical protein